MISRLKIVAPLLGLLAFAFNCAPDVFAQLNPSITTTTVTPGVVGTQYSFTMSGTGGTTPYTWSATGLPPGFPAINPSSGVITGTPTTAGSFNIAVTLRDLTNRSAQKNFTFTIYTPLSVTTQSLPSGTVDTDYPNTNLTATGGATPYTWKLLSGSLPDGLNLSGGGRIDGKPKNTAVGTTTFTVQVADNGVQTASKTFSITITPALSIDTSSPLASGAIGIPYSLNLAASGGIPPYTWSLNSGTLPAGLTLSAAGVIGGTTIGAGMSNFVIQVADTVSKPVTKGFALTIIPPLSITTSSPLPNGTVGTEYSQSLAASGGAPPYVWSVTSGTPPAGLTLSAAGVITGTPTTEGTANFTVQVRDNASQMTTKSFVLAVDPPPLSITTASPLPNGAVGTSYSQSLAATGGTPPYTWSVTGAPTWLTLSAAGVISGVPTAAGTANFTVQVRDNASRTSTKSFALTVDPPPLSITTVSPLPSGTTGAAYSQTLAATGGTPQYTWSVTSGTPPAGLTLSAAGVISGTPTTLGTANFTVQVRDSASRTATKAFAISVSNQTFSLTNVPDTVQPTQQMVIGLTVSPPQPNPTSGSLSLSFTSTSVAPTNDDPSVMFSNGSKMVPFTIPANGSTAVFPTTTMLLAGTVSGTILVKASIQGGVTDVPVKTVVVPATNPKLTNVKAVRMSGGLRGQVTDYTPERRVINVDFGFDVKTPSGNQRVTLSRTVQTEFDTWYRSGASSAFGSSFTLDQLFTVQGDTSGITAVTVTLTNGQGPGSSPATNFN